MPFITNKTVCIKTEISPQTVISLNRHREKKVSKKYNKPHCIIPIEDMQWVINQAKAVQTLWNECWATDQYGSRWMKLTTSLSERAFRIARKILYTTGLFEFKRETCIDDSRKTAGWLVINLHGSRRLQDFWQSEEAEQIEDISTDNFEPNNGINDPNDGTVEPNNGIKRPPILPESIEKSSVSEPLSISSETSQEVLKELPEENITTNELALRVRSRGGKLAEKLTNVMERCLKLSKGEREQSEDEFIRELFTTKYKWRIDDERFKQLCNLTKECKIYLLEKFKHVYQNNGMSAPRTFDKAMSFISSNVDSINNTVRLRSEAFKQAFLS